MAAAATGDEGQTGSLEGKGFTVWSIGSIHDYRSKDNDKSREKEKA